MTTKKRDGAALWRALQEAEALDDLEEIEAMSEAELDAYITANGGDPAAIRARGGQLGEALLAQSLARDATAEKLETFRAQAAARGAGPRLPRAELLARLDVLRRDPRPAGPVAMLFQKKPFESCTDDELQNLVDTIDLLSKLDQP